jgi:hypothetical protein
MGEKAALCHLGTTATAVEGEPCVLDFLSNLGMLSSLQKTRGMDDVHVASTRVLIDSGASGPVNPGP